MEQAINFNHALAFHLEGLYQFEKTIEEEFPELVKFIYDPAIRTELASYGESSKYKRMKLKRVFGYLLVPQAGVKNSIIQKSIRAMEDTQTRTELSGARDLLMLTEVMCVINYKVKGYDLAIQIADRIDLPVVSDLLEEIKIMERNSLDLFDRIVRNLFDEAAKSSLASLS